MCQLLPVTAQEPLQVTSAHPGKGTISAHIWSTPNTEGMVAASHDSIYLPQRGKRDNSQVPGPFRKYPLFSSVQMNKRDLQQMMCL